MTPLLRLENASLTPSLSRQMVDALVQERPESVKALELWLQEIDFDKLDYNAFRLVPALFHFCAKGNVDLPYYGRMKGIYRHFHYKNTLLFAEARKAVSCLVAAGINVLCFKGAAYVLQFGWPLAIRPMDDFDLLVPRESFEKAKDILLQNGWQYLYDQEKRERITHSVDFLSSSGYGLDLHTRALLEVDMPSFEDGLFARAVSHDWNGLPIGIMSAEDLALITLVNGVRKDGIAKYLWIYDLVRLVKDTPALDWKAVWERSKIFACRDRLFDALALTARLTKVPSIFKIADDLLTGDVAFAQKKAVQAVASGQTYGRDDEAKHVIKRLLVKAFFRPFFFLSAAKAFKKASILKGYIRHIRLLKNDLGQIEGLWTQHRYLHYLQEFFTLADQKVYRACLRAFKEKQDGLLSVPVGLLAPRLHGPLRGAVYKADIQLLETPKKRLGPRQKSDVRLIIKNRSHFSWFVFEGATNSFGLSYHLFDAAGSKCILWDLPRCYFISQRKDYLVFLEPKGEIEVTLTVSAPDKPGFYTLKFDGVHENVCWFSEFNSGFPEIKLEVQ